MKKSLSVVIIFICIITIFGIKLIHIHKNNNNKNTKIESKNDINLKILTTDKLLYYMVKDIVGNKHSIDYMFGNRQDEINFKFSEDSLDNISKENLFIYFGVNFEPWINDFIEQLKKNKVGVINASRGANIIDYSENVKMGKYIIKNNPYYWMDLDNCKIILLNIKNSIQDKDPRNREYYEKNFNDVIKKIDEYKGDLGKVSKELKDYYFVTPSENCGYFFQYNNIDIINIGNSEKLKYMEQNLDKSKKIIFVYNSKEELKQNEHIIKIYNMKPLNLIVYNENMKYEDILSYNIKNLESILKK